MNSQNERESFQYTYSAKQQEEIKNIRDKYIKPEKDKMEMLRRLDHSVTQKGTLVSLIVGICGTLIMGFGMSCAMVWQGVLFVPGIIIGILGIAMVCVAYPLYNSIVQREREKKAPEILRLVDELLQ